MNFRLHKYLHLALQAIWQGQIVARLLLPVSVVYQLLVQVRRWCYARGFCRQTKLSCPLIVVGNFIVGGAGKTPVVLALVEYLKQQGWNVGVISRGYGRQFHEICSVYETSCVQQVGDEPLLIALRAKVPVVVGQDRIKAAQALLVQYPQVNILVSDDGLQHLALCPDIRIIVFDERGIGNGFVLPAGPLREPLPLTPPSQSLILYNAHKASTQWPGHMGFRSLRGIMTLSAWHLGQAAQSKTQDELIEYSWHSPVWAAAGIASPERFFNALRLCGFKIIPLALPDHFNYVHGLPWTLDVNQLIITEKDAVKLIASKQANALIAQGQLQIWVAPLDFAFSTSFMKALEALMPAKPTTRHVHG